MGETTVLEMATPRNVVTASPLKPWWKHWLGPLLLIAAVVLVYWPAMYGNFLWDDDRYISLNVKIRSWNSWWEIWFKPHATGQYYPLTFSAFSLIYHACGLNPFGFHLTTVLLHGVTSALLWQVLKRLEVRGAWLAAAIFAFHPVNAMSVAWMTELKNTLSLSLTLGAAWAYVKFAGLGMYEQRPAARPWPFAVLALGLFLLAMFAKTAVSFLPVTLFLVTWWKRDRIAWRRLWPLLAMLGIALGMGMLTLHVEHLQGATGEEFRMSFWNRVLLSGRSFWFYLGKLFFPYELNFIYEKWKIDAGVWWQSLFPAALFACLFALWRLRGRIGKGVLVAVVHFYIATSMLVMVQLLYMMRYSYVTDHWQYFGCLGIFALAAAGLERGFDLFKRGGPLLRPALCGALLFGLGVLTWRQAGLYKDDETLWRATVARNPTSWMAHNIWGNNLEAAGKLDEAFHQYSEAQKLGPGYSQPYNNLGNIFLQQGRLAEAKAQYQKAIAVIPRGFEGYYNMGIVLEREGNIPEAIRYYEESLGHTSQPVEVLNHLGVVFAREGKVDEAIKYFLKAVQSDPTNWRAYANLGKAYAANGQAKEADYYYGKLRELNPGAVGATAAPVAR